jgi:two-component system NarL family response regulator
MTTRVLLADDHQLFREALRMLLEKEPDIEVVGETGDGTEVPRLVREKAADVVCMDVRMPGMNGVETTRRLMNGSYPVKIIGLSAHPDHQYVVDMIRAGAAGYVTKSEAGNELIRAIRNVGRNRVYLCPEVMEAVSGVLHEGEGERGSRPSGQLGARERQVLQLVAEGCSSGQIAERLHIATSTVEVHRRNIMRKLDLHNVADLTRYSIRSGIVSP